MPKQIDRRTRCTLVIASLLALSFVGCRTATSRLASLPGMGWIDRGERSFGEGWADYESAPNLPPPSTTSEPTSTSSTSGLAVNSGGSNSRQGYGFYDDTARNSNSGGLSQTSRSSADAESNRYNTGSTYGNYALGGSGSSYGAFGSSRDKRDPIGSNTSTPQQGFYGSEPAPNYVTSTPSSYGGYGNSGSSAINADAGVSRYGDYAASGSGSRYGSSGSALPSSSPGSPTYDGSSSAAAYTATRNSRIGGSGFDGTATGVLGSETGALNSSSQNATRTYTPPGFPSSSYPTSNPRNNTGSSSPFDTYKGAVESASDRASQPVGVTQNSIGTAASPSPWSTNGNVSNNYAVSPGATMRSETDQTQPAIDGPHSTVGGYGDTTRQSINNVPGGDNTQIGSVGRFSGGDRFGGTTQGISPGDQQRMPSASSTMIDPPTSNTGRYADALLQATPNQFNGTSSDSTAGTTNGYIQAARDGFGQSRDVVQDYARVPQGTGQNAMEQYNTPNPQYPSTSTPHSYLPPSTFAPTTPPSSSIQRSSTPWRPGSTSDFQGSNVTGQGSTIQTSYRPSLGTSIVALDVHDDLTLAVGDRFQFPRLLR